MQEKITQTGLKIRLKRIKEVFRRVEEEDQHLCAIVGGNTECSHRASWVAVGLAINLLEDCFGDESQWISWFIFDNCWGKDKKIARFDNQEIKVVGVKQLWKILQWEQSRNVTFR